MPPRRGNRSSLIDDDALLGSSGDYQNFSIDASDAPPAGSGVVGTMKGWWADDRKRKLIIGSIIASVILLIIVIAIAASASSREHHDGGGGGPVNATSSSSSSSSSSTGGGVIPTESSSTATMRSTGGNTGSMFSSTGSMASTGVSSGSGYSSSSSSSAIPPPPPDPEHPWLSFRLPTYIRPYHYDLYELIDIDQQGFGGTVDILLHIDQPISHLVIHSVGLVHSSIDFFNNDGSSVPLTSWYYAPNSYLVLNFTDTVVEAQGGAKLSIAFGGQLRFGYSGLYLSRYRPNATAAFQLMASTQFEEHDAREAFPCFDEPAMKATFSITIHSSPNYPTVLSNMPVMATFTLPNGFVQTAFNKTVVMSTYLVAFVVTDYVYSEEITLCATTDGWSKNITTRVYAPSGLYNSTIIPARIAAAQIAYYCQYFDIPYPLEKEDHIMIPAFAAGAMENWGLITYQSYALLWDPAINNLQQLIPVSVVIAHELAHQWFGNLVTAAWWSNLWLNEGFATFVEYIGSDYSNPELMLQDQFISLAQREAMYYDSSRFSHPIITDTSPSGAFDSISYAKGGSIIRMMEGLLTRPVFLDGIKQYLKAKSYQNAFSVDLFGYLDAASARAGQNYNVTEFMAEWTQRAGYPLVNCSTITAGSGEIVWTCTQTRFFSDPNPPIDFQRWQIPVSGSSSRGAEWIGFWSQLDRSYTFTQPSSASWLKLNANSTGFYRVLYDQPTYALLSGVLNQAGFGGVHHDDRLGLLSDVYVFAQQSLLSYPQVLDMSLFLQHDRAFTVWEVAYPLLAYLYSNLRYTNAGSYMAAYMQQALSTAAASINVLNTTGQTAADELLEMVIGDAIVRFNAGGKRADVQAVYQQLSSKWPFSSFTDIDPNLIALVLQVGVADGTMLDWEFVYVNVWLQKLLNADDPVPAVSLAQTLAILAAPRTPSVLQSVLNSLNATKNSERFNGDDTTTLLRYIALNDIGLPLFNDWIQQPQLDSNTPAVLTALNAILSPANMRQLISFTLSLNVDSVTLAKLVDFYTAQTLGYDITGAINAGRDEANRYMRWAALYYEEVAEYLISQRWVRAGSSSSTGGRVL